MQKPQFKYSLKTGKQKMPIKKDTITMLLLIKKEREKKLKSRFPSKTQKKKDIFFVEKDVERKPRQTRVENFFPKSIPFKINKTMSQYFKRNEKKKTISNNELFFL